jgi:hypothetical protein
MKLQLIFRLDMEAMVSSLSAMRSISPKVAQMEEMVDVVDQYIFRLIPT